MPDDSFGVNLIQVTHLSATCHYSLNLVGLPPQLLGHCRSFDIILQGNHLSEGCKIVELLNLKDGLAGLSCFFALLIPD